MELIDCPAYIVLDIPSPMAEKIRAMRQRFDAARSLLPAEITLTGSCGVGLITKGTALSFVQQKLNETAEKLHPFSAELKDVERFPNTNIFFLTLKDEAPFLQAHRIIAESGIPFDPSPYPYKPHCTVILRKEPENAHKLMAMHIPREAFQIDTLSVYAMPDANSCELIHKVSLQEKRRN